MKVDIAVCKDVVVVSPRHVAESSVHVVTCSKQYMYVSK